MMKINKLTAISGLLLLCTQVWALDSDFSKPIEMYGQKSDFKLKEGLLIYEGNVFIKQGTLKIEADRFVLKTNQKGAIQSVTLTGKSVRFQQQLDAQHMVKGTASKIVYDASTLKVTLSGQVQLLRRGADIRADSIVYGLKDGNIAAQGSAKTKVKIVLQPLAFKEQP